MVFSLISFSEFFRDELENLRVFNVLLVVASGSCVKEGEELLRIIGVLCGSLGFLRGSMEYLLHGSGVLILTGLVPSFGSSVVDLSIEPLTKIVVFLSLDFVDVCDSESDVMMMGFSSLLLSVGLLSWSPFSVLWHPFRRAPSGSDILRFEKLYSCFTSVGKDEGLIS